VSRVRTEGHDERHTAARRRRAARGGRDYGGYASNRSGRRRARADSAETARREDIECERRGGRQSPVTGPGPDLSPSVARHHNLSLSVLRLLGVAPNLPLAGRVTIRFLALDYLPVQFLSATPAHPLLDMLCEVISCASSRTLFASEPAALASSDALNFTLQVRPCRHDDRRLAVGRAHDCATPARTRFHPRSLGFLCPASP
jgi:hypothetical protein